MMNSKKWKLPGNKSFFTQSSKPEKGYPLKHDVLFVFCIFIIAIIAYQPALKGTQIWDDDGHITKPELRSFEGLKSIWTQLGATQQYYPLVHTVFWLEYRLWGESTFGYHLLNILLHIVSVLLLIRILRFLQIPRVWLIGIIFALHPIQVESVAWITELKNTLSGVFYLSAAIAYLVFNRDRKPKYYAIALILFALGLMTKSVIATLPVSLLAVIWWKHNRIDLKKDITLLLPFLIMGIASGLFTGWVENKYIGAKGSPFEFTLIERCLIAGRAFWFYLSKLCFPINLTFIYPRWNVSQTVWWQYLFPIATISLASVLFALRTRWRAPFTVFVCFSAAIFPVMGFFNIYPFRYSFVADHFQYLACIAPIVAIAALLNLLIGFIKKHGYFVKPVLFIALLLILSILTWNQSQMYSDAESLYKETIIRNPSCWMAYTNLGNIFDTTNRLDEAMFCFEKSLELYPLNYKAFASEGKLLAKLGRTDDAIAKYKKAVEIKPLFPEAYNSIGNLLAKTGRKNEALFNYQQALKISPADAEAHNNLGNLLADLGRVDESIEQFNMALNLKADYSEAHYNLANVLNNTGKVEEAISHYLKAVEINPFDDKTYGNLGNALYKIGRTQDAIANYQKALELNPNKFNTLKNLAYALEQNNQPKDAIPFLQRALALAKSAGDGEKVGEINDFIKKIVNK